MERKYKELKKKFKWRALNLYECKAGRPSIQSLAEGARSEAREVIDALKNNKTKKGVYQANISLLDSIES